MYEIDVATGHAESLDNRGFAVNEYLPSGLASHNGKLYMIGRYNHMLYTVDTATGAATAVSDSTVNFGHNTAQERFGLASHNGKLYTLNDHGDYLETIDATTGATTRVGASRAFGVNEGLARDLTVHGGALYMVGRARSTLYTLNTTTGAATSAVFLGGSISQPVGIATGYAQPADYSIGSASGAITYTGSSAPVGEYTLYAQASDGKSRTSTVDSAVDDTTQVTVRIANRAPSFTADSYAFTLATRSNGSVTPVSVGTATGADPDGGDTAAYSFRGADMADRMYVVQDANSTDLDSLYSVDSSTGRAARVGDAANFRLSSGNAAPAGLTWHNGKLYFAGYDTGRLYVVDATTGEGELAGTSANFGVGENKPTGLASHGGMLYLIGESTDKLYTLDPATGVATAVSSSAVDFGGSTEQTRRGLASHSGVLYTLNDGGDWLEALNTTTGVAARVGASSSFGVSETAPRGLASHGGSLHMVGAGTDTLYTLNTTTGAATSVGALGNAVTDPTGLASGYAKPSDFAISSTTGAVTYTGSSAVAGQYTLYAQLTDGKDPDGTTSTAVDDFAAVTVTVVGPPAAATNLAAASDHQSAALTASITDDGGASVTRWEYKQKLTTGGSYPNTWTQISSSASNTLSHTVTDLTNGTSYTFKVRAVNSSGASADSNESTVTPQANAPAAATNLTATASNTSVTLAASITDDGGSTVTRWEYLRKNTVGGSYPNTWTTIADSASNSLSFKVTGLTNGTSYTFKVRAVNSTDAAADSNEVAATPALTVPAAATDLSATAAPTSAILAASITDDGGSTVTRWEYKQKLTDGGSYPNTWTAIASSASNTLSHTVTDLTNGTSYTFKARAVNSVGAGGDSNEASAAPGVTAPAAATDLAAASGNASVTLTATTSFNGGAAVTRWEYKQKSGANDYPANWTQIASSASNTLSHTVSTLTNGTAYTFKVRAVNSAGSSADSNEATATPATVPAAATNLTATPASTSVRLAASITDDGGADVTRWEYKQKSTGDYPANWTQIASSASNTLSHTVSTLTNGTAYTFKVRAVNSAGSSADSNEATATPATVPAAASDLTSTAAHQSVTLAASITDDGGADVTRWEYNRKTTTAGSYLDFWIPVLNSASNTFSHKVSELDNGTSYTFKVRPVNSVGAGGDSNEVAATPASTAPAAASNLAATSGNASVKLSASITDNGGSTVTRWEYNQKSGGGDYSNTWTQIASSASNTLNHTVTDLTNSTAYTFKVRAVNSVGDGSDSNEVTATPASTAPAAATNLTAATGNTSVTLTASITDNGGSTVTRWEYNQKSGGGDYSNTWTQIASSASNTLSHTVTTLTNGTAYTFKVRAVNSIGDGGDSNEVTATPAATAPAAATNLTAATGNTSVTLTASITDNGGSTVTRWEYNQKSGGGDYSNTWTQIASSASNTLSHTVSTLTNGTAYTFKVRAVNSAGDGGDSNEVTATPATVPAAASNLTATRGDASVTLAASITSNGGRTVTGWEYKHKSTGDYSATWTAIASSASSTLSHTVSTLTNGTAYTFKVRAVNSIGGGADSNEATATPATVPAAATDLAAAARHESAVLTASISDNGGTTVTRWEYNQKSGANDYGATWTQIASSASNTLSHTVSGLTNATAYTFKVRAVNAAGNGADSNETTATPASTAPAAAMNLTATRGDQSATLAASITDNGGATVTRWEYKQKTTGDYPNDWTQIASSASKTLSHTVSGLTNATAYTFKVRAVNSVGSAADSNEATATPRAGAATAPAAATNLAASSGNASVALTASITDNGGSPVLRWEYVQKSGANDYPGTWTQIASSASNSLSHTITDLTNSTAYTFKVRAVNSVGAASDSNEASATPAPVAPAAAANLAAAAANASVTLTASITDNGGATVTGWEYKHKTAGNDYPGTWTQIASSASNSLSHTVTTSLTAPPTHSKSAP